MCVGMGSRLLLLYICVYNVLYICVCVLCVHMHMYIKNDDEVVNVCYMYVCATVYERPYKCRYGLKVIQTL